MIVLVGFMGAGKTTVGKLLADRLGVPFLDSDQVIEAGAGRPVPEIFASEGEVRFREIEQATIEALLEGPDAVLALGGGSLGDPRTRAVLSRARVVHLEVPFAEAMDRVGTDPNRPMLRRPGLEDLHAGRAALYRDAASVTVDTAGRDPEAVAQELWEILSA